MRSLAPFVVLATALCLPLRAGAQEVQGFEARSLKGSRGVTLPYRLFKVKNPEAGKKYPLILFLHGAGERGNDNAAQLTANQGATVWTTEAHQAEHPAYVIAPQCPANEQWVDTDWTKSSYSITDVALSDELSTALEIADAVAEEFDVDPARHYVTGLSMGGYGTWDAVLRHPTRFAAALAVCGAGDPTQAERIKSLPLWAAHGDADTVVPVSGSRDMVTALKALGSDIEYSEYAGVGHDAWTQTYANETIVDWLFTHQREPSGAGGAGGRSTGGGAQGGAAQGGGGTGGTGSTGTAGTVSGGASSNQAGSSGSASSPPAGGAAPVAGGGNAATPEPTGATSDDGGCTYAPGSTSNGRLLLTAALACWLTLRKRRPSRARG